MALKSLSDENGEVSFNSDGEWDEKGAWSFESLGDPALDRIMLRCQAMSVQVRQLAADVARIKRAFDLVEAAFWMLLIAFIASAVIRFVIR